MEHIECDNKKYVHFGVPGSLLYMAPRHACGVLGTRIPGGDRRRVPCPSEDKSADRHVTYTQTLSIQL